MYPDPKSRSQKLYDRALASLPGGNTRTTVFMKPYPIYAARGEGWQPRNSGSVLADPGIVIKRAEHIVFERGLRLAAEEPTMGASDDDHILVLGQDERGRVERPNLRRVGDQQK